MKETPTEQEIQAVIEKCGGDIRKLAIAYLKASHRASKSAADAAYHKADANIQRIFRKIGV